MKLELLIILNDTELYHRSVSQLNDGINPYTGAINALVNELTQGKVNQTTPVKPVAKPVQPTPVATVQENFHPDLVKAGVAPKEIPTIKLDMKTIMKDAKNGTSTNNAKG